MINFEDNNKPSYASARPQIGARWTIKNLLSSIMIVAVAAILVVVVLAYMTQITFNAEINWSEQGANAVLLVVCSVAVTIILRAWGIMKGQGVKEHLDALAVVEANVSKIIAGHNSGRAAEYCRDWENRDYENTVERALSPYNLSIDKFKEMRIYDKAELATRYPTLSKAQITAVLQAKKIKMLKYSEDFILTNTKNKEHRMSPSTGLSTRQRNTIMTVQNVVLAVVLSTIMVSFSLDIIADPTLATVVSCLLKVITIVLSGLFAAYSGYNLTANIETERFKLQAVEQERFLSFCELHNAESSQEKERESEPKSDERNEAAENESVVKTAVAEAKVVDCPDTQSA